MSKPLKKPLNSIFGRKVPSPTQEAIRNLEEEAHDDITECQHSAVIDLKTVQGMKAPEFKTG